MNAVMLAAGAALLLALPACDREPPFEERYENAQKAVASEAAAIDAELAERARERREAGLDQSAGEGPASRPAIEPTTGGIVTDGT